MFFDGEVCSKRVVSAAGSKRDLDKNALLATARKQREERALDRLRYASALRIQKRVRGRSIRAAVTTNFRLEFDTTIGKIEKMKAIFAASASRSFQVPTETLAPLFRSFIYFYQLNVDKQRLRALLVLYEDSCSIVEGGKNNIWQLALSESALAGMWNKLLPQVLKICMGVIESHLSSSQKQIAPPADAIEEQCLQVLDSVVSKVVHTELQKSSSNSTSFYENILSQVFESSCLCLSRAVGISPTLTGYTERCISSLSSILIRSLSNAPGSGPATWSSWGYLSRHLLTLPHMKRIPALQPLVHHLGANDNSGWMHALTFHNRPAANATQNALFIANVFDALAETPATPSAPLSPAVIKALCHSFDQSYIDLNGRGWVASINEVLDSMPLAALMNVVTVGSTGSTEASAAAMSMEVDDLDMLISELEDYSKLGGLELLRRHAARAHERRCASECHSPQEHHGLLLGIVNVLMDKSLITRILDNALNKAEAWRAEANVFVMTAAQSHVLQVLSLYSKLLAAAPIIAESKIEKSSSLFVRSDAAVKDVYALIVNQIAWSHYRNCLASRLWRILSTVMAPSLEHLLALDDPNARSDECELIASAVHILCCVLHQQLLLTDDEEFFEIQAVVTIEETEAVISFLRRLIDKMVLITAAMSSMSNKSKPQTCAVSQGMFHRLQVSAVRLFNQLYCVNERRRFFPESLWHVKTSSPAVAPGDRMDVSGSSSVQSIPQNKEKLLLACVPQVIPFNKRVGIFQHLLEHDKRNPMHSPFFHAPGNQVRVQRDNIVQDSFEALRYSPAQSIKGRLQIEFISTQGYAEAGIDGGGLFKEFIDLFTKSAFDPSLGLFVSTSSQQLVPNPASQTAFGESHLQYLEFIGKMLGKALYDKILVESQFSEPFLNVLKGVSNQIDDLYFLDAQLHKSLIKMKSMTPDEIAGLGLSFEVERYEFGKAVTIQLVPGGSSISVDKDNVSWYIHRFANYKLEENKYQCRSFLAGFHEMIPNGWIRMFSPRELQLLISGDQAMLNIADLRRNVTYHGYDDREPYIETFWQIVGNMTPVQQCQLLKFVTSCSRQPLLGFEHLAPKFGIQLVPKVQPGDESKSIRLPGAATCMNLLKLPRYESSEQLLEKLLYAIGSNSGFELS